MRIRTRTCQKCRLTTTLHDGEALVGGLRFCRKCSKHTQHDTFDRPGTLSAYPWDHDLNYPGHFQRVMDPERGPRLVFRDYRPTD